MCSTHSNKYTAASSPAQRHFTASEVRPPGRIFGEFAIIPSLSLSTFRLCIVRSATCWPRAYTFARVARKGAGCMQWRISFTSYFVREIHVKGLNSKFVNDSKHGRRDIRAECIHESNFPRRIAAEQFENATFLHRPLLKYCFFFLFLESGRAKWFQSFTNSYKLFWLFSSFSMRIN